MVSVNGRKSYTWPRHCSLAPYVGRLFSLTEFVLARTIRISSKVGIDVSLYNLSRVQPLANLINILRS